jgi:glycosyltransferase involved in cell wall biosynthesis
MSLRDGIRLSLGLLAHNEERGIGRMLQSLFLQSIFCEDGRKRTGIEHVELVCVPNGCTDRTTDIVSAVFEANATLASLVVTPRAEAGKARAWNAYVHELSDPRADYLILLDADIMFATDDVLEKLIVRLEEMPSALVSTDTPIKGVKVKAGPLSLKDRASLSASEQGAMGIGISGQLYCARAAEMRRIWMPTALPVEDGFLAAMVYTDGFTVQQRPGSITTVIEAIHYYEAHEDIAGFLRHERRIVVGSVINAWLFSALWEQGGQGHVGRFIERKNVTDPAWLDELIAGELKKRGMWLIPSGFMFKRLSALRKQSLAACATRLPIALVSTALQLIACMLANRTLRRSRASHFW